MIISNHKLFLQIGSSVYHQEIDMEMTDEDFDTSSIVDEWIESYTHDRDQAWMILMQFFS